MSALDKLIENDLVSNTVYDALTLRPRRNTRTGFIDICCPMCVSRGETPDRKFRCGVHRNIDGLGVNCFNCGFKALWKMGERLGYNMRTFIGNLGVSRQEIQRIAYWADQIRPMLADRPDLQAKLDIRVNPEFPSINLPPGALALQHWAEMDCTNPDFLDTAAYLFARGDTIAAATTYYWTSEPGKHNLNRRLIVPCYHQDRLVGWIARAIFKDIEPSYHKILPANYLFNAHFLTMRDRKYVFIVEGVFDALSIDGVAALGASLNDTQISWIVQSGKQPVVVADRDKAGERLVNIAIKHGWPVATIHYGRNQWWDADIKDSADAAKRYGKLYTIQSIISNLTWGEKLIRQRIQYRMT